MNDYRFVCDNGSVSVIRASTRRQAIALYCAAEGCSVEWVKEHCVVRIGTGKERGRGNVR